ncbi:MAG: NAD-dependent epimerase/dehydratase family protein [Persicimonas sp.]
MDLEGKTIAITGVGGFIGGRMLERAIERGIGVRGLDISPEAAREAGQRGADVVVGGVNDAEAVAQLCQGADVVFHTAAMMKESGSMDEFRRVNVEGTRTVAKTAAEAGVERMVHLSSVMVYGFNYPAEVTEDGPKRGEDNPYCTTKWESEEAAMAFHALDNLKVTVIRPGDVYGPGSKPWVVRPLEMMKKGLFMLPDGGGGRLDPTYVDNLIDAVFLTLELDATGEAFNVTDGRSMRCVDFFSHHAQWVGEEHIRTLPAWLLGPAFKAIAVGFRAAGKEPPATPDALKFLNRPHSYSNQKARQVLGFAPRVSFEEGMRRTHEWLEREGLL